MLSKQDMLAECPAIGIKPPRLYGLGFSHNNFFWTTVGAAPYLAHSPIRCRCPKRRWRLGEAGSSLSAPHRRPSTDGCS